MLPARSVANLQVVDAGTVMPLPGIAREASKSVDKILTR